MPSIFSRARTASTPSKSKHKPPPPPALSYPYPSSNAFGDPSTPIGEFGQQQAFSQRPRSLSQGQAQAAGEAGYGAVGFLPTTLPSDLNNAWASTSSGPQSISLSSSTSSNASTTNLFAGTGGVAGGASASAGRAAYGLLSPARDTVLGLPDVARLVAVLCAELERTGVSTPFVFSSLALDVRRAGVARLVRAFLATCAQSGVASSNAYSNGGNGRGDKFTDEARFAAAHELGMCLRWGLSRVVRVEGGREVRGLLSWAWYERWRTEEGANAYPPTAFSTFLTSLPAELPPILAPLFALCNKLVAHSGSSGHTPPSLASIFGPVLFGLSAPYFAPAPMSPGGKKKSEKELEAEEVLFPTIDDFGGFGGVYDEYLRGARAAEHLLLASIREGIVGAEGRGLGAPTRLREWVGMYPASLEGGKATGPRRGAKTTRLIHVKRNVRAYSQDLVRGGSTWASAPGAGGGPQGQNEWAASRAWRAILAGGAGVPRYADSYRKRLDLAVGVHPSTSSLSSSYSSSTGSTAPTTYNLNAPSTTSLATSEDAAGGAFRSLTDLKWGEFESLGFGSSGGGGGGGGRRDSTDGIELKLKFDLTENARAERLAKRETLSWTDFSAAGFSRSDAPLSATLQFSPPLALSLSSSSQSAPLNAELTKKLRKAHKALPAFGWDTSPMLGPEELVEEAFLDVFCDLLWGGGWMERAGGVGGATADLARECSWALVEYKSRTSAQRDPGSTLVLFEEFVPREYRLALAGSAPPGTRRRLPALFSPSTAPAMGGKTWKQASTLNGRPYVLGATPIVTGSTQKLDFESMLKAQGGTKLMTLNRDPNPKRATTIMSPSPLSPDVGAPLQRTRSAETQGSSVESGDKREKRQSTRFRLPGGMIPGPSPGSSGGRVPRGARPAEYAAVDFETRLAVAGESDDEAPDGIDAGEDAEAARQRRRASASDAWVDILVGSMQGRRLGGQDAEMPRGSARRRAGVVIRDDPDLAGLEAAQALAAETIGREMSPDPEARYRDSDVVEIERVPRKSEQSERSVETEHSDGYGPATDDDEDNLTPGAGAQTHPVLSQRQEARQQRRLGYFDLHPERRPVSAMTQDDDPRSLLSQTDSDDEDIMPVPRNLDLTPRNLDTPIRPLPTPTRAPPPSTSPQHVSPVSPVDIPTFTEADNRREQEHAGRSKADSVILTPANGAGNGHAGGSIAAPKPAAPSKTSALIDMFREREQGGRGAPPAKPAGPSPIPPSRLPVRTAAPAAAPAPVPPAPAKDPSPPKTLPKSPAPVPAPAPAPAPAAAPPMLDPPPPPLTDAGRASPARYVHGAPLHNVLEEEEEES